MPLTTHFLPFDLMIWKVKAASQQARHLLSFSGDRLLPETFHSI